MLVMHLAFHGMVADGVLSLSAILAGTILATDELVVIMAEVCDDLQRVWSPLASARLGLTLVVDDLGVHVRAIPDSAVDECRSATEMAMQTLADTGCMVSAGCCWAPGGNTVTACSSQEVMCRLRTSMRSLGG